MDGRIFESQEGRHRPTMPTSLGNTKTANSGPSLSNEPSMSQIGPNENFPPMEGDDAARFRRTISYQSQAMQSLDEALKVLSKDKRDARANQFMGWWYLSQETDATRAIHYLKAAEESGIFDHLIVSNRSGANNASQEKITRARRFTYLGEPSATPPSTIACHSQQRMGRITRELEPCAKRSSITNKACTARTECLRTGCQLV